MLRIFLFYMMTFGKRALLGAIFGMLAAGAAGCAGGAPHRTDGVRPEMQRSTAAAERTADETVHPVLPARPGTAAENGGTGNAGAADERPADGCETVLLQAELAWGDVEENLARFEKRIEACRGKDVIIFPELFVSGCEMQSVGKEVSRRRKEEVAAAYPRVLERMRGWAAATGALVMGSTIYREEDRFYNRLLAAFPDGRVAVYDKHNCFKKGSFSPGEGDLVLEWKGLRWATYICYDLRFPEWSRNSDPGQEDGRKYDVAVYIANWPATRRGDWIRLLRERAVENGAYVIGVNCAGPDPAGLEYAGDSRVIAPDGAVADSCRAFREDRLEVRIAPGRQVRSAGQGTDSGKK